MKCKKCKKDIPENSIFCIHCGVRQTRAPAAGRRGNKQGSAVKRGKTWSAVWTEGIELEDARVRVTRRWKGGFATKTAALAYASAPPEPSAVPAPEYRPTLSDYHGTWESSDYRDLGKSKQCAFRIAWRKLEPLHDRAVASLTISDLQGVVDDQAETYYPARDMRTLLSHLFKRAVAEGQARTNLALFIRIPPLNESEQQPFTDDEVQQIWKSFADGDRVAGLILLMIYSGMMPGELKLLKVSMINIETREIIGCGLKTKKRRQTPILYPESVSPVVEQLLASVTSSQGYVLGMNSDNFYDEYHTALNRAGVRDLPPYSCRHTTATALAAAKASPTIIKEIMRHTTFSTTQRYIHPDRSAAHAAIDVLNQ